LRTAEVKHLDITLQILEPIAYERVRYAEWQANIALLNLVSQRIYQDQSPPPPLRRTILYSVFRI
jgi:hypothetical protein